MLLAASLPALLIGCAGGESSPSADGGRTASASDSRTTGSTSPFDAPPPITPATSAALENAALNVASFLAGDTELDTLMLADTVELHLAPEGAATSTSTSVRLARNELRERDAWRIGAGNRSFSFVPPKALTKTTVRAGTHFACREVPLASRAPALATRPHVGVRREPPRSTSCLETWNVTFVFDTIAARPALVAALYDQWEW